MLAPVLVAWNFGDDDVFFTSNLLQTGAQKKLLTVRMHFLWDLMFINSLNLSNVDKIFLDSWTVAKFERRKETEFVGACSRSHP